MNIDTLKLYKEIRKLAILRHPMFQIYIKQSDQFHEWDLDKSEIVRAQEIQGYRIPVNLDDGHIIGEIVVARRPLMEEEKGIGIMIGNHIVVRSDFGFGAKLNRITGLLRCDALTSRFADKSALIEDDAYYDFNKHVKQFIIDEVIPKLTEYEDVLITKEESRIYREIDKVLGQAVVENLESIELEEEEYETVDDKVIVSNKDRLTVNTSIAKFKTTNNNIPTDEGYENTSVQLTKNREQSHTSLLDHQTFHSEIEPRYFNSNERIQPLSNLQASDNLDKKQIKKNKNSQTNVRIKKDWI